MVEGNNRVASLKAVDAAMDFGEGVSLAALAAATAATKTKLESYNQMLSQVDDALNALEAVEKTVADLSSRLLSGVRTKYGANSSQYEQAGGTRTSTLPDFFIGAHAQVTGLPLLTRDVGRYRTYFPKVMLIAP